MARLEDGLADVLPGDGTAGALGGRVWLPRVDGPAVVAIRDGGVFDISRAFPTMRDLCEAGDPAARAAGGATASAIGALADILANTPPDARDRAKPWLLAPIDLQAIKAAGVTFVDLDARAGDRGAGARRPRAPRRRSAREVNRLVGDDLAKLKPGSPEAARPEGGADRAGRVVAVSRGRHRPGRRDLHQGAADGGGRHRHGRRAASELDLEQPGARGRAGRRLDGPDRRRDARQRRQPARRRGPLGAAALARRRTTTPPARSARSSASSTTPSRSTTCAAPTVTLDRRRAGRLPARGLVVDRARSAATRRISSRR